MPEPSRALLLAAHKRNPIVTATTQALPDIRITIHAAGIQWLLERGTSSCADAVREGLVVPVRRVLEHQPSPRLADSAPALAFVAVSADPPGGVQVAFKPQVLLTGGHFGVGWIHVLLWGRGLFFAQTAKQVRRVRQLGVAAV